ncbi:MAG: ABC transporter ATP-binding protein [Nitriliruptorales bacterium]
MRRKLARERGVPVPTSTITPLEEVPGAVRAVEGQSIVSLRQLGKVYEPSPTWMRFLVRSNIREPIVALADVDLDVYPGEIYAIVGPNGAGKTTLFRILIGLTTPSTGSAAVFGLDASSQSEAVRRLIGWMPAEDRSLFMRHTCAENLFFHGRLHGLSRHDLRARIPEILDEVGLAGRERSSVFSLSSGMRARLQLARALLPHPRLLILDEPTAAVDPVGAYELLQLIMRVVDEHRLAALISSHRLEEIEALHSHVALLDRGRIRYKGDLEELRRQWDRPQVEVAFSSGVAARRASQLLGPHGHVTHVHLTEVACSPNPGVTTGDLLRALAPVMNDIRHIRERPIPLRELLAKIYLPQLGSICDGKTQ